MTSSQSPSPSDTDALARPNMRRRTGIVRRIERCCSVSFKHFPLVFVYGVTTWAVYSAVKTCLVWPVPGWLSYSCLFLSLFFYAMLNWSYTVAVFTDPGSPLDPPSTSTTFSFSFREAAASRGEYSYLPTTEPVSRFSDFHLPSGDPSSDPNHLSEASNTVARAPSIQSLTVKSTGGMRFCKKCQTRKPDRAHHCSTCGRCVLKMDHHCPWLATCVGLKNYKPFLLFCSYVTLFCAVDFAIASSYIGNGMMNEKLQLNRGWFAVNVVLLAILAGVFGLVLAGFTGWHLHLTLKNQTTIEALETTRYLRPIRRTMDRATAAFPRGQGEEEGLLNRYGHQLAEMHANAVPGVTREEEGEERNSHSPSPHPRPQGPPHPGTRVPVPSAHSALQTSYARLEAQRERERYESYLDEQETFKMPHAFDRGWRQNLFDLFGPDWRLWFAPLPSTLGDGWSFVPSERWTRAQEERRRAREERARQLGTGGGGEMGVYSDGIHDGDYSYPDSRNDERSRYGYGYGNGNGNGNGAVPTSIPYAGDEFQGVNAPLPISGSYRSGKTREGDASSVEALYAVDNDDQGGDRGGTGDRDVERGAEGLEDDGEDGWRDW